MYNSPDTKQYAFVSKGTADQAYDNVRVYREERIEKDGNRYYYWMLDSGPAANALAGLLRKSHLLYHVQLEIHMTLLIQNIRWASDI